MLLKHDPLPPLPARITLTRVGRGTRPMDFDGLVNSLKSVRDAVARHYDVDDGSDLYRWEYKQERGKEYAVVIMIEPQNR